MFLGSTVFMVVFSVDAVDKWASPWGQISVAAACLIPPIMLVIQYGSDWINGKNIRKELYFVPALIFLGILNVLFGQETTNNFKGMGLFLLPFLGAFMTSTMILRSYKECVVILRLYCGMLLLMSIYGIWQYSLNEFVVCNGCDAAVAYRALFSSNPIPAGAIILCLFSGPIILLSQSPSFNKKATLIVILILGAGTIFLLGKRAAIISLLLMAIFLGIIKGGRYRQLIFLILPVAILSCFFLQYLPIEFQEKIHSAIRTPVQRLEMYFYAIHVFKDFPLFGIGVWTSMGKFLWNYDPMFTSLPKDFENFKYLINYGTSFHNIFLYLFVHMGALFSMTYFALIFSIFLGLIAYAKKQPGVKYYVLFYFIWLSGLLIPGLTATLLMYPDINFVFHSMLGLALNFKNFIPSQGSADPFPRPQNSI